jgi:hypothetical protein
LCRITPRTESKVKLPETPGQSRELTDVRQTVGDAHEKLSFPRKLFVFVGNVFEIFLSHKVMMLSNVPVHKTAQELGVTRQSIYAKSTELSPP